MNTAPRVTAAVTAVMLSLAACGKPAELWPSPEASPIAGIPNTGQRLEAVVRVTAAARPVGAPATMHATPLWMSVENGGPSPVVVDRASLRLVGPDDSVYRALPVPDRPAGVAGGQASVHPVPVAPASDQALPDEAIAVGGRSTGWVFFETVAPGTEALELRGRLEDPLTGDVVTELRLPFDAAG